MFACSIHLMCAPHTHFKTNNKTFFRSCRHGTNENEEENGMFRSFTHLSYTYGQENRKSHMMCVRHFPFLFFFSRVNIIQFVFYLCVFSLRFLLLTYINCHELYSLFLSSLLGIIITNIYRLRKENMFVSLVYCQSSVLSGIFETRNAKKTSENCTKNISFFRWRMRRSFGFCLMCGLGEMQKQLRDHQICLFLWCIEQMWKIFVACETAHVPACMRKRETTKILLDEGKTSIFWRWWRYNFADDWNKTDGIFSTPLPHSACHANWEESKIITKSRLFIILPLLLSAYLISSTSSSSDNNIDAETVSFDEISAPLLASALCCASCPGTILLLLNWV